MLGKLADRVSAVKQYAFFAINIGQRAFAAGGRLVAWIIGELARCTVKFADVDDIRANAAFQHREGVALSTQIENCLFVGHACLLDQILFAACGQGLRVNPRERLIPSKQDQHIENSG